MDKTRILVVEDEALIAGDIAFCLRDLGYEVTATVASGDLAIAKAQSDNPGLILMDIKLQGEIDGIQAAEQIRLQRDVPIIFLTAFADEGFLARAKVTGPSGYILKPFKQRELHATIEMALYKYKIEQLLRESEEKFQKMTAAAKDAIIMMDSDGIITFWNEAATRIFGFSQGTAIGAALHDLIIPQHDHDNYIDGLQHFHTTGTGPIIGETLEIQAQGKGERYFPVEISLESVQIKGIWHAIGIVRDISERKLAQDFQNENERKYLKLHQTFQAVLPMLPGMALVFTNDRKVTWANDAAIDELGLGLGDIIGRYCYDLWVECSLKPCTNCSFSHDSTTTQVTSYGGETYELQFFPYRNSAGTVEMISALVNAVTMRHDHSE